MLARWNQRSYGMSQLGVGNLGLEDWRTMCLLLPMCWALITMTSAP